MPVDCGFDWNTFLSEWGLPGLIILGGGLFVYRKAWPTFEKFLDNMNLHLRDIAASLSALIPAMREHEASTREALDQLQALSSKTHERHSTTRKKAQ